MADIKTFDALGDFLKLQCLLQSQVAPLHAGLTGQLRREGMAHVLARHIQPAPALRADVGTDADTSSRIARESLLEQFTFPNRVADDKFARRTSSQIVSRQKSRQNIGLRFTRRGFRKIGLIPQAVPAPKHEPLYASPPALARDGDHT